MSKKLLLFAKEKGVFPHLGLGYIASYLRKYLNYYNISIEEATPQILEDKFNLIQYHKPYIIGFTCLTAEYNHI